MTDAELLSYVKTNLRQLTERYDDDELVHEINGIKEDIEESTGRPFDITSNRECMTLVCGVKARFGGSEEQERYEMQYQRDLAKLGIRRMGGAA